VLAAVTIVRSVAGGIMPGFATTVQVDEPLLLDRALALASAD